MHTAHNQQEKTREIRNSLVKTTALHPSLKCPQLSSRFLTGSVQATLRRELKYALTSTTVILKILFSARG